MSHAALVTMAGVLTGVIVGGIGGRIVMRLSAIAAPSRATGALTENANRIGDITLDGTLELVIFVGLFSGLFGGLGYLFAEPWLQWTGRWHPLAFATALLLVASPAVIDPESADFPLVANARLNVVMFAALFVAFGLLVKPVGWLVERWVARAGTGGPGYTLARATAVDPRPLVLMLALALLTAFAYVAQHLLERTCSCDARNTTEAFLLAMAASTFAVWALLTAEHIDLLRLRLVRVAGFVAGAGALGTGAYRFLDDVRAVLEQAP